MGESKAGYKVMINRRSLLRFLPFLGVPAAIAQDDFRPTDGGLRLTAGDGVKLGSNGVIEVDTGADTGLSRIPVLMEVVPLCNWGCLCGSVMLGENPAPGESISRTMHCMNPDCQWFNKSVRIPTQLCGWKRASGRI